MLRLLENHRDYLEPKFKLLFDAAYYKNDYGHPFLGARYYVHFKWV